MDPNTYLQMQGKTREELIAEAKPEAEQALRREAVLRAVADTEGIEVTEDDLLEALQVPPGHEDHGHPEPKEALEELRKSGRDKMLTEDLRMREPWRRSPRTRSRFRWRRPRPARRSGRPRRSATRRAGCGRRARTDPNLWVRPRLGSCS